MTPERVMDVARAWQCAAVPASPLARFVRAGGQVESVGHRRAMLEEVDECLGMVNPDNVEEVDGLKALRKFIRTHRLRIE